MGLEIFREKVAELKNSEFETQTIFTNDSIPEIPEEIEFEDIFINRRQRFASQGLIDNLEICVSKEVSTALGLWILACYFQKNYETYTLFINDSESKISKIIIEPVNSHINIEVSLEKFCWTAQSVESFSQNAKPYFGEKILMTVTNDQNEVFNLEQFYECDVLTGFGKLGGGLLAAEFFLNFGLEKSDVNYEHIRHSLQPPNLADKHSCESRVMLLPTKK